MLAPASFANLCVWLLTSGLARLQKYATRCVLRKKTQRLFIISNFAHTRRNYSFSLQWCLSLYNKLKFAELAQRSPNNSRLRFFQAKFRIWRCTDIIFFTSISIDTDIQFRYPIGLLAIYDANIPILFGRLDKNCEASLYFWINVKTVIKVLHADKFVLQHGV